MGCGARGHGCGQSGSQIPRLPIGGEFGGSSPWGGGPMGGEGIGSVDDGISGGPPRHTPDVAMPPQNRGLPLTLLVEGSVICSVDVISFGAIGDGVHDDARAIQDAITFVRDRLAPYDTGEVCFPEGNFRVNTLLDVYSRITLKGTSPLRAGSNVSTGTQITAGAGSGIDTIIRPGDSSTTDLGLRHLTLNAASEATNCFHALVGNAIGHLHIDDVFFRNAVGAGFNITGSNMADINIRHCLFSGNGTYGMVIRGNDYIIDDCMFRGNTDGSISPIGGVCQDCYISIYSEDSRGLDTDSVGGYSGGTLLISHRGGTAGIRIRGSLNDCYIRLRVNQPTDGIALSNVGANSVQGNFVTIVAQRGADFSGGAPVNLPGAANRSRQNVFHVLAPSAINLVTGTAGTDTVVVDLLGVVTTDVGDTHDILSSRHGDAATDAVTRGSVIIGNSTPEWDELVIGAARRLLQVNAGATDPEWAENIDIPGTLDVTGAVVLDSTLQIGADVVLSRGAANRLDLASGDSLHLVSGSIGVGVAPPTGNALRALGSIFSGDEATQGTIEIHGAATGSTEGGELRFHLADDHDATFATWNIDVSSDDLRFFSSDAAVTNIMTAEGRLTLPTSGSGAGLLLGGDVLLFREAANLLTLGTSDRLLMRFTGDAIELRDAADVQQLRLRTNAASGGGIVFGSDILLERRAANALQLASGDNFELVLGNVKVGGSAAHATTAGTNIISIFLGTAPVGTLASGGSLYVATATNVELNYIDSAGNAEQLSTT